MDFNERKVRERENKGREERLLMLEKKMEDQEKKRQVREAVIDEALNELKGKVSVGVEEYGRDWSDMAERIEVLEGLVKGKEGITSASGGQISERMRRLEEREKKGEVERIEMERLVAEKMRSLEEGLEKEKKDREKKESERMEEEQQKKVRDSEKEMERKVFEAMGQLKILNLRFRKESEEKGELLKEAEAIIRGKVKEEDKKECEWILRRSKVYILGKGTEEKVVKGDRICTVPVRMHQFNKMIPFQQVYSQLANLKLTLRNLDPASNTRTEEIQGKEVNYIKSSYPRSMNQNSLQCAERNGYVATITQIVKDRLDTTTPGQSGSMANLFAFSKGSKLGRSAGR